MTTLTTFHASISTELNKGTSLDSLIPTKVRQAAKFLERNYNFDYMWRYVSFTIDPNCGNGAVFTFPARLKRLQFFRLQFTDETDYRYLKKVDPQDVIRSDAEDRPVAYWFDANEAIYLDSYVDEAIAAQLYYSAYTNWPTDYSQSPALLDVAEDVLFFQTLMYFAPTVRQPDWLVQYKALRDEALVTVLGEQQDRIEGNQERQMGYE